MSTTTLAPHRTRSAGRAPVTAVLDLRPDGSIGALSSNGQDIYTVRLAPRLSCTCPGFAGQGHCYHSTAAVERYGGLTCQHCGHRGQDVAEYAHRVTGAEYTLCTDTTACLSRQGWGRGAEVR